MIIDVHTHCFPNELAPRAIEKLMAHMPGTRCHTDGTQSGLLRSMHRAGIDYSITLPVATRPDQVHTINSHALAHNTPPCIPFGALFPGAPDAEEQIQRLVQGGIRGVKLHPEYQDFFVDDPSLAPFYEVLEKSGLIVVFHAGWDPGPFTRDHATPQALRTVADSYPGLRIIAAHLGGYLMADEVVRHLAGGNLWYDTSAQIEQLNGSELARMVRVLGVERVLFGSDTPWFDQSRSLALLRDSDLDEKEIECILWRNGAALLGEELFAPG